MKIKQRIKAIIAVMATVVFSLSMAIPALPTYAVSGHSLTVTFRDNSLGLGSVQYSENSGSTWTTVTENTSDIQITSTVSSILLKIVPNKDYEIDWAGIHLNDIDMTQDDMNALSGDGYIISTANAISLSDVEFKAAGGGGGGGDAIATLSLEVVDTQTGRPTGEGAPEHIEYHKDGDNASPIRVGLGRADYAISPDNATYYINNGTEADKYTKDHETTDISAFETDHDHNDALRNAATGEEVMGVKNTSANTNYSFSYAGGDDVTINIQQSGGDIITKLMVNNVDYTSQVPTTNADRTTAYDIEHGRAIFYSVTVPKNVVEGGKHSYSIYIEARPVTEEEAILGNFGWCYNENDPTVAEDDLIAHGTIEFVKATYGNLVLTSVEEVNEQYAMGNGVFQWKDAERKDDYPAGHDDSAYGEALFPPGTVITVKLVPDPGYQLVAFTLNGFEVTPGGDDAVGEYTFDFHPGNFHLGAEFGAVDNDVSIESTEVSAGMIELADGESAIDIGTVKLDVEDTVVPADKAEAFSLIADEVGYEISNYLDISLFNTVYKGGKTDEQGNLLTWDTQIDNLDKAATVSLALEEDMSGKEVVIIHEIHDGEQVIGYETIPCEYLEEYNAIQFETDGFSNYAIATKESTEETTTEEYTVVDESTGIELSFTDDEGKSYEASIIDVLKLTAEQMAELGITATEYAQIVNTIKSETSQYGTMLKVFKIDVRNSGKGDDYKGQVNIKIPISDDMKQYNVFKMIYIDPDNGFAAGDVVELKVEGNYLVGTLPHLSVYALVGSYVETSPQTGDFMNTFLMLFALGGGTFTTTVVLKKRKYETQ